MVPTYSYCRKQKHIPQDEFWTEGATMIMIGPADGARIIIAPPNTW